MHYASEQADSEAKQLYILEVSAPYTGYRACGSPRFHQYLQTIAGNRPLN
jgi:hypothetical protein